MSDEKVAFSSFIGHKVEGLSLLDFLCKRFTYFGEEEWSRLIEKQEVLLNGEQVPKTQILKNGDEVRYIAMLRPEPQIPTFIPVLFEDEDLLIVNKPPHIPVHPGGRYLRNTLIHLLRKQRKIETLFLSHRLDRETSGVCVLSKTHIAKEKMYWQFFRHEVEKIYWALCWGELNPPSCVIDAPIGDAQPAGLSKIRIKKIVGGSQPKTAKTKIHTLSKRWIEDPTWTPPPWPSLKGREKGPWPLSLVECRPITGRTNQIRVHLAHIGSGIVGDKLYDPDESVFMEMRETPPRLAETPSKSRKPPSAVGFMNLSQKLQKRLILDAHALHAKSLAFRHPRTGQRHVIQAPPPRSWQGLYEAP